MQEHDTVDGGVFSLDNSHHIKKSKKRKISEESWRLKQSYDWAETLLFQGNFSIMLYDHC